MTKDLWSYNTDLHYKECTNKQRKKVYICSNHGKVKMVLYHILCNNKNFNTRLVLAGSSVKQLVAKMSRGNQVQVIVSNSVSSNKS